ncbi:Seizure 6-like protein [Microtus ochrogaster]|uniref:Seizure 6-like protein n=1 Tax=Microtus ochrogaster TaxID=79684 RepID=A0A8J6GN44_MICOH|nr:Seizure 6-like protein [Microtus ochrogaster]
MLAIARMRKCAAAPVPKIPDVTDVLLPVKLGEHINTHSMTQGTGTNASTVVRTPVMVVLMAPGPLSKLSSSTKSKPLCCFLLSSKGPLVLQEAERLSLVFFMSLVFVGAGEQGRKAVPMGPAVVSCKHERKVSSSFVPLNPRKESHRYPGYISKDDTPSLQRDGGPEGDTHPSTAYLLTSASLESNMEEGVTSLVPGPLPSQKALEMLEGSLPPALPDEGSVPHTPALRKGLPSLKQLNSARKQLRPLVTPTTLQRLGSPASATTKPRVPGDPEQPTAPAPLQIVPFTTLVTSLPNSPEPAQAPDDSSPGSLQDKGDNELTGSASEESQETTTSTIITTTIITTEQAPALCSVSFSEPEGYIDSNDFPPQPLGSFLECTYNVTVYTGYGVELQVKSVNLSEGELLSIRGVDGPTLTVLANQTLLVEGQVIRSPTNAISVYFRTFQDDGLGTFQLHYQAFMLSCSFPRRPEAGDVTVMDLHSGGVAHFHCHLGYELQGAKTLTCINASKPHWSSREPVCSAPCGGAVHNATIGRVLSPSYPGNANSSQRCVWTIEAPAGQKLHLHLERLLLQEKDRMIVYSGQTNTSALLYDSLQTESVPFEGLLSEGSSIRIEFTADQGQAASAFNIRFEEQLAELSTLSSISSPKFQIPSAVFPKAAGRVCHSNAR